MAKARTTRRKRKPDAATPSPRHCRFCGAPEKIGVIGTRQYSNLTPYSGVCCDCLNRAKAFR